MRRSVTVLAAVATLCPDFGQVQFTNVTANGQAFATASTVSATNLERSGVLLTQDGPLTGTSFPVTWLHA